jgi:glycosyltransferase 2 family protein
VSRRRLIQAGILLAIGLLILYGLLRTVHPDQVLAAMRGANPGWIALGLLSSVGFIAARSWRWQIILAASVPAAGLADAAAVTAVGFAVNSVSPFKLGELLRIGAIAQRLRIGVGEAGATVILERILDVLALLVLAIGAALLSGQSSSGAGVWGGLAALSGISVAVGIAAYAMVLRREQSLAIARRLAARLPERLRQPLLDLADSTLRGLTLLRSPGRFVATGVLSLVVWIGPVLGLAAYFRSVSPELQPATLFLAVTLFVITQAISVTPASVGTYEGLFVLVLGAFGAAPASVLTAAAVIAHVGGILTLLLVGAVGALWLRVRRPALPVGLERPVPS